ncbi:MAG: hypothetical protein RLZZ15_2719 [Verrucomicrobiota bacterium]|jgi:AraC-like DNA-binding protein
MHPLPKAWQETTIDGPRTRRWSLDRAACGELASHRIAWLGLDVVHAPYRRVRLAPSGSFFLATLEGEGRIFLEGRWERVTAGSLCLAPPRVLNAFHAHPGAPWAFAWIRYEEPPWAKPIVGAGSPLRLAQGAEELGRVLAGLRAEWEGGRDPALVHHWVSLAHGLAARATRPWRGDSRIGDLWAAVAADLTVEWKLTTLAGRCGLSPEHLRRVCRRELGRTPMEHVTYMRIQQAQELLETTEDKLEAIAPRVGYHSAGVFSRAFVRCVGLTPSQYRERRRT